MLVCLHEFTAQTDRLVAVRQACTALPRAWQAEFYTGRHSAAPVHRSEKALECICACVLLSHRALYYTLPTATLGWLGVYACPFLGYLLFPTLFCSGYHQVSLKHIHINCYSDVV